MFAELSEQFTIDYDQLLTEVLNEPYIKGLIIDYNQSQLESGLDANNKVIKTYRAQGVQVYADYTIKIKRATGQPTNKVTLRDTGEFYNSMRVLINNTYIHIVANFDKQNGNIADNLDISNVLGLNDENLFTLTWDYIYPDFLKRIKQTLGIA